MEAEEPDASDSASHSANGKLSDAQLKSDEFLSVLFPRDLRFDRGQYRKHRHSRMKCQSTTL